MRGQHLKAARAETCSSHRCTSIPQYLCFYPCVCVCVCVWIHQNITPVPNTLPESEAQTQP